MTRKYIAPNVAAQIFWLKNRKPKQPDNTGWADKQEIEIDMDNDPLIKFAEAMATFKLPEDAGNH